MRRLRIEPLDLVYLMSGFVALRVLLARCLEPLGAFDEGLLFANAQMMRDGHVAYRDFYSNYPPGIFQLVRAAVALTASPILVMRCASFAVHLATAACSAVLVGRARGRAWCFATFSCIAVLQADTGLVPYAYTIAVLMVLGILLCWPSARKDQLRTLAVGIVFGCLSYVRHDVFLYILLPLTAVESAWWIVCKRPLLLSSARQTLMFLACVVASVLGLWLPVIVQAGVSHLVHDLYLDMGRVMAARVLPIPPLLSATIVPGLSIQLPGFLAEPTRFGLVLGFVGVPTAVAVAVRQLSRSTWATQRTRLSVICAAAALATLPQALGRTDYWHVAFGLPLVVVALFRAVGAKGSQVVSLFAIVLLFSQPRALAGTSLLAEIWHASDANLITQERRTLASFIESETRPGEPIFLACQSHRRVMMSVLDLHYLAHRPGATRYMQFDPGLVTTAETQAEMIADLERTRPSLMLRYVGCLWDEPNASMQQGASLLDDYLQMNYAPVRTLGTFEIWRRMASPKRSR